MSNPTEGKAIRELNLGLHVEKSLAALADANIFATTILLQEETGTQDLCAATTVTSDPVGTVYFLTGEMAVILNGTANAPIVDIGACLTGMPHSPIIFGRTATANAIQLVQTGDDADLVITWHCYYVPLEEGAYVEAA